MDNSHPGLWWNCANVISGVSCSRSVLENESDDAATKNQGKYPILESLGSLQLFFWFFLVLLSVMGHRRGIPLTIENEENGSATPAHWTRRTENEATLWVGCNCSSVSALRYVQLCSCRYCFPVVQSLTSYGCFPLWALLFGSRQPIRIYAFLAVFLRTFSLPRPAWN